MNLVNNTLLFEISLQELIESFYPNYLDMISYA